MAGRKKGTPKTGGRQKGTPNRTTAEMKGWINELLLRGRVAFMENLSQTEPKDFCKVYLSLMGFVIPKMVAVSAEEIYKAEYNELEALFDRLPDEAIERIAEKVLMLEDKSNEYNRD